jgi:predicted transcriptional regulator
MIRFTFRIPEDINEKLVRSAKRAQRSKTAHILWILRVFLSMEDSRRDMRDEVWMYLKEKK